MKKLPSRLILYTLYLILCLFLSSCFLLGIHTKVTNPKHAGTYPKISESLKLLGSLNKYRNCFDATFYELNISVDEKNKYLKGKILMNAIALSDFDTLQIDLYANMKVNTISFATLNSIEESETKFINASYVRKHGAIFVALKQKVGEIFKLKIEYEGKPVEAKKPPWRGGFVWEKDKEKNSWIGVVCETEGASLWWPCKDVTNDDPDSASINITVSKDLMAVSNGQLRGKEENEKFVTYKWFVSYPINLWAPLKTQ